MDAHEQKPELLHDGGAPMGTVLVLGVKLAQAVGRGGAFSPL